MNKLTNIANAQSMKNSILELDIDRVEKSLHPSFDVNELATRNAVSHGIPASFGCACGVIALDANHALATYEKNKNQKIILVREQTTPDDIDAMKIVDGIVTSTGGKSSHAAIIAGQMGKCCVVGVQGLTVGNGFIEIEKKRYNVGDIISVDGYTGKIYDKEIKIQNGKLDNYIEQVLRQGDGLRKLRVFANADTPKDVAQAINFGADGVGVCRTEHMFFEPSRIKAMQKMIAAKNPEERTRALAEILPMQRNDFYEIFRAARGLPVTIRLIDPPLHEFIPDMVKETNPMLGHRGVRLLITYPEIAVMQTQAIIEAAVFAKRDFGVNVNPEIMIPLVADVKEIEYVNKFIRQTAENAIKQNHTEIKYKIGAMIETPRAALLSDEIAKHAEFFSYGTNDLTQMTYGFSRDDGKFLDDYAQKNILERDPFVTLDKKGVGKLVEISANMGKTVRKDLKVGVCGEQGADAQSIEFCNSIGLDYVSVSPYKVPIARLAAAQAAIKQGQKQIETRDLGNN
jgi:pyruvate,orthophosphate dikinase